ncbi:MULTISPECIES: MarR family winged helix-turn-helix transcriptional regulator [unclassified Roseovarius]|uniref:MarR family winged helix-turn-helix transcriptional regulator n=1 Tax=unclassified Roseovarius TaxID=2614913 RepID=UPI00273EEC22|nr:MarR family transcriptional regulator [Roseovarius sp. MMSF_3350]
MTPLPPPDMLCFALYSTAHRMQQTYKPLLAPLGLTYPQYLLLSALWSEDARTVGALGRELQLESNTLTPLIKRLESKGLVQRTRDTGDDRQVRVTLTDSGRALQAEAAHIPDCIARETGMAPDDLTRLRDEILALRNRLSST